jgi:lipopolysaccharide export system permease protein
MIGKTLGFYFARQFATLVISIFLFFFFLVFIITYLEFFTRTLGTKEFDPVQVFLLTLYRVPSICEEILPFTTLFGRSPPSSWRIGGSRSSLRAPPGFQPGSS